MRAGGLSHKSVVFLFCLLFVMMMMMMISILTRTSSDDDKKKEGGTRETFIHSFIHVCVFDVVCARFLIGLESAQDSSSSSGTEAVLY